MNFIIFIALLNIGATQDITKKIYCKDCFVFEYYEFWVILFVLFCFIIHIFVIIIIIYRHCIMLRQYNNDDNILNLPI
jgi:uncharacterized membrane protein